MKGCDVCLFLKAVCHKLYNNLQLFSIFTHFWKNLSIDFIIDFSISIDWKSNNYHLILIIVNCLIKIIYYKPVKVKIDTVRLAEIIIDMIVRYHGLPKSIISGQGLIFISKFWLLLYHFFDIKRKLFMSFYPQINRQTKR